MGEKVKPSLIESGPTLDTLDTIRPETASDATIAPESEATAFGPPPAMPEHRYEYGVEIARGGMGRVLEATDTMLGRLVAVKEALSLDPEAIRRFQRETRITARLEHPSIVPVHDAGVAENGSPFYVMRKISGRPLEELVGMRPELIERLALLPHIVAAANAIAHAHERGIVHRDIKPSNILAGELGETTVIDWGLAKVMGEPEDRRAPSVDNSALPSGSAASPGHARLVDNSALPSGSAASPGHARLVDNSALPSGSAASPGHARLVDNSALPSGSAASPGHARLVDNSALPSGSAASPGHARLVDNSALPSGSAASPGHARLVDNSALPSGSAASPGHARLVANDDNDVIKTRAGVVFGTPGFMAPEQLRGAPPDERCDVYALGATLYHLLARRPPHYAQNGAEMMRYAVSGPPQPLRELAPGVSPELATIVDTALAFDRNLRYRDARALADELQRFLTGQLVASHHYSNREKLLRWVAKNRALVVVTSAAIAVLILIASFSISRIVAARDRADDEAKAARAAETVSEIKTAAALDAFNRVTIADGRSQAALQPTGAAALVKHSPRRNAGAKCETSSQPRASMGSLSRSPHLRTRSRSSSAAMDNARSPRAMTASCGSTI